MSDERKPKPTVDSFDFRNVMWAFQQNPGSVAAINNLIAHIDAWGARLASEAGKDAERYQHLRSAQWFKAGFAMTEADASAFRYGGEVLDSLIDAQIAGAMARPKEDA